ncbi:class I SAM-dependent methyltransferase [Actinophytocola glycyrrhizae]|uniref:Class I SAM-dependent methyltransferase n=1 Tax=Actinophytocola glycyrrhizae TaxID=2044873 RepID=A0ABV9S0V4_9PSEU
MTDRIARAWDAAAQGYDAYYVPRFAPWVADAVGAVTGSALPDGPVLVPCCGTFPELPALVEHLPGREIVGIDLSAGMVRIARAAAARHPAVSVLEGDAATLDARWDGACAAVVSVFGLQQLPGPAHALRSWAAALRPGGRLSVVFWPGRPELDGPFALMSELLGRPPDRTWEDGLTSGLTGVERDEEVAHPITHPDAATCFDAHVRSGPLRPLLDEKGPAFVEGLRAEFLRRAPAGEWVHRPGARHIVAVRDSGSP